ncbi:leucine-rich repeat-containing protein 56 isoform X1 [Scyliorhinus canicula]|uniref:leucine-rich repeat-containing protein 56 isoform X1 n=1 Tax=Scyliorhinus canicula TaxID=7830 RepID=UPI0018F64803|nr:leucine-rich repeat-containing protein 56 isoform X1 [Scyliorhinus canicula]XP_038663924.1 leucine-rich repeat-containing protein 56 isoform X1 [Scyliorhinus canicula]XP_038663925.1 leucine-rich repeat-containing protein 56 isoform X1 [Scyliorhinus canicula]XP_038663926.1 leucine-rich repeat-containing protein 56 isoform X1 [Scyliorhinus canicula]XP_038663927.1 leucine-rich repeat-containing protein 56 isoform X1 [Scyliorhinus canicula]
MELHQHPAFVTRAGTATVRVLDFGQPGLQNPNPVIKDETEFLIEEYLSPSKLRALTETEDLRKVKVLEMCVDTQDNSLGNFGAHLPSLVQLKLNSSFIASVRDLGTSLTKLQVLWMARCSLTDLDGIPSFCSLKELYVAYNSISDVSPVSMLEHLEVLDLEGNNIADIVQIHYVALCSKLNTLTLEGNPFYLQQNPGTSEDSNCNYREMVKKLIPHLKYLDDIPVSETCIQSNCTVKKDWLIVKEAIKDGISAEDLENLDDSSATGRPASRKHKNCASRKASTSQRPHSAGRLSMGSTVGALRKGIPDARLHDGASDLTHGAGSIFCGNPVTALRARRKKQGASSDEAGNWFSQYTHLPEHTYDSLEIDSRTRDDIFSELRAWRDEHNRRLEAILKEQEAQVLKIDHNDNDALSNSSTDEEKKDDYSDEWNGPESPCPSSLVPSSLNFPSNMESLLVADFNRMLPPVPPSLQEAPARSHKVLDFRVRCLRRSVQMEKEPLQKDDEDCGVHDENREAACSHGVKPKNRLDDRLTVYAAMKNLRPVSGPATVGLRSVKSKVDRRPQKVIDSHQPIIRSSTKTPERPLSLNPVRPLTAKAALQRLPNRPLLLPSRGNKTTS